MPIDPKSLPQDADTLRKIVVDLAAQLDRSLAEQNKYQSLLRELLEAQHNRKREQLTKEQLALFEAAWQAQHPESRSDEDDDDEIDGSPQGGSTAARHKKRSGAGARRWRSIWCGNGLSTIWRKRKNTAPAVAGICG